MADVYQTVTSVEESMQGSCVVSLDGGSKITQIDSVLEAMQGSCVTFLISNIGAAYTRDIIVYRDDGVT